MRMARVLVLTLPLILACRLAAFWACGVFRGSWRYLKMHDVEDIIRASVLGSALFLSAVVFLHGIRGFPRAIFLLDLLLSTSIVAGSRLLVQESVYEDVIDKLKRRLTTLRVGDPLDKNTDVGAINSRQQLEKIKELVAAGEQEGAEIYQPPCKLPEKGYWFVPTVFTNVAQSYRIAQEEIFGPVVSVIPFDTEEEAVARMERFLSHLRDAR